MWNGNESNAEMLSTWIRHSPTMQLASSLTGQIFWANDAFCEWSGYTLNELKKMTWMQLSVQDSNLEADLAELRSLDQYKTSYTVRKQYVPKNDKPQWGKLTVIRYPASGEIQCCLCNWEPMINGTAEAFAMAIEAVRELRSEVSGMNTRIDRLEQRSEEENWIMSTVRLAMKHPRMALAICVLALSTVSTNQAIMILKNLGLWPATTIHVDNPGSGERPAIGKIIDADDVSQQHVVIQPVSRNDGEFHLKTPLYDMTWRKSDGMRIGATASGEHTAGTQYVGFGVGAGNRGRRGESGGL